MEVFLLLVIILLIAPWLLDIALFLAVALISLAIVAIGCIYLYLGYSKIFHIIIQIIIWAILILVIKKIIYDGFIKHVIDGYNGVEDAK